MGTARRVLVNHPVPSETERNRTREQLEKKVEHALGRLKTSRDDGGRNRAYVMALIRLNEFLLKERVLLISSRT
jgi:hypothetical protein